VFTHEDGVADYTLLNATKEGKKHYASLQDLSTRVNMTRDAMDEDEHLILPINMTAVGCILLEFTNALSEHMVRNAVFLSSVRLRPTHSSFATP
jgi:hypothetical protein